MTRRSAIVVLLGVALVVLGAWAVNQAETRTKVPPADMRRWRVYYGSELVLDVSDQPGPLVSTALPPPNSKPVMHPFLSASAHSASHEDELRTILTQSNSVRDFLPRLSAAGYTVKSVTP